MQRNCNVASQWESLLGLFCWTSKRKTRTSYKETYLSLIGAENFLRKVFSERVNGPRKLPFPFIEGICTWLNSHAVGTWWRGFDRTQETSSGLWSAHPTHAPCDSRVNNSWKWWDRLIHHRDNAFALIFFHTFITSEIAGPCWGLRTPCHSDPALSPLHYANWDNWTVDLSKKNVNCFLAYDTEFPL